MSDDDTLLPLPSFANQVAGHRGVSHEGGAILVPEPGKIAKPVGRGYFAGEDMFYRSLASYPALAEFCPAYLGMRQFGGRDYVILEDLTYGMQRPLVVDIKVGTCTVAPDAPWAKRITHLAKDRATTTRSLGLRIVGVQTSRGDGTSWSPVRLGKAWGKALRAEDMRAALRTCFSADGRLCTSALSAFLPRLHRLKLILEREPRWQFVSSSLLFVFQPDSSGGIPACHMRVIDFAHAYPLHCARDAGYLYGLTNLIALLESLVHDAPLGQVGALPPPDEPPPTGSAGSAAKASGSSHSVPLTGDGGVTRQKGLCELPVDLQLSDGEVGYLLERGGDAPHEASVTAALDRVRLHTDELLEALAHSPLGRWAVPWRGFVADLSQLATHDASSCDTISPSGRRCIARRETSTTQDATLDNELPKIWKNVIFDSATRAYCRPHALCFRLGGKPCTSRENNDVDRCHVALLVQGEPAATDRAASCFEGDVLSSPQQLHAALSHFLAELPTDAARVLLDRLVEQLDELHDELRAGAHFQFAAASVWLICEMAVPRPGGSDGDVAVPVHSISDGGDGGDANCCNASAGVGSAQPAVRLSHFAGASMTRHADCDAAFLAGLRALRAALAHAACAQLKDTS